MSTMMLRSAAAAAAAAAAGAVGRRWAGIGAAKGLSLRLRGRTRADGWPCGTRAAAAWRGLAGRPSGPVLVAGLDEAGRGAVLGPMTVALVGVTRESEQKLLDLGVKDSKALTPARRAELAEAVRAHAELVEMVTVEAEDIDERRASGENLNEIEYASFMELLRRSGGGKGSVKAAVVDSYERVPEKLQARLAADFPDLRVVAETKADAKYVAVAAASIVAKDARDKAVKLMQESMESTPIGSGYPSDPTTRAYLDGRGGNETDPSRVPEGEASVPRNFVRKSWRLQGSTTSMWKKGGKRPSAAAVAAAAAAAAAAAPAKRKPGRPSKKDAEAAAKLAAEEGETAKAAAAAVRPETGGQEAKEEKGGAGGKAPRAARTKKPPPKMSWSIIIE